MARQALLGIFSLSTPQLRQKCCGITLAEALRNFSDNRINREANRMKFFTRLWREEDGQGLVEYTLVVVLVALVFWIGVRNTNVGSSLVNSWSRVMDCVTTPFSCSG